MADTLSEKQGLTPVTGFNVYDTVLIMHLVEKLLRGGGVTGRELSYVAQLRDKAVKGADTAVGFDIETLMAPQQPKQKKTAETQGG
jgi:hypothetical protein